ncbi:RibD family protein [Streptomyces lycii]|uniref:RibD family protein n=1 Tax=Streptomyces lycii TaxID=2654337 RepID=UPI001F2978F2|nr:RibD family protein [Streptomyces lycii]
MLRRVCGTAGRGHRPGGTGHRPGGTGHRPGGTVTGTGRAAGSGGGALDAPAAWERLRGVRTEADARAAGLERGDDGRYRWRQDASAGARDLADRYLPLCLAGPRVAVAQLGQSVDGFIATRTGDSDYVTGEEDRDHLHRLRALCDAVLVGAGTAVADDPRLTVRACTGADPVRVVLDPHRRVPPGHRLFTDGAAHTLWMVGPGDGGGGPAVSGEGQGAEDAGREPGSGSGSGFGGGVPFSGGEVISSGSGGEVFGSGSGGEVPGSGVGSGPSVPGGEGGGRVEVLVLPDVRAFAPHRLLGELARRGLGRVLVEGGGVTVSRFLHAGALDRLYVTVAPLVVGDGVPGIRFPGPDVLRDALRPPVRRTVLGEDTLFEFDLSGHRAAAAGGSAP